MLKPTRNQQKIIIGRIAAIIGIAATFGLLASFGIALTKDEGRIAILLLPNALLVAVLLRSEFRSSIAYLPAAFIANITAYLYADDAFLDAVYLASVNQFEIILIWLAMRKIGLPRPNISNLHELSRFALIGGVCAPMASGFLAAIFLAGNDWISFLSIWLKWASRDGLGMLLIAPTTIAIVDVFRNHKLKEQTYWTAFTPMRSLEWIAIQALILIASIAIFAVMPFPALFLVAPLVLLSAFRLGAWGTALSTILISIVVAVSVALKLGPFYAVDISLTAKLFIAQIFLLSCFAVGMPVAAILAGKEKIREELRDHQDLSNSMLQNMTEVIFRTNAKGEWVYLNPAWENLTGLMVQESIGRTVHDLIPETEIDTLRGKLAQIWNGANDQCTFDWTFQHQSGEIIDVEVSISGFNDERGFFSGAVGNIRDVTDRKSMELNLVSARRHAEAAADAKSRFLANMSHEIRTPMNGVLGFTQLLLDSELSKEQRGQAQMILDSGDAMMRLLNNILDISKVEAGQMNVNVEPIDVAHILQGCIKLMAPTANQKDIDLRLEIDTRTPDKIAGDGHHLRQIIINLLGNAIKFTSQGHIILRTRIEQFHRDAATITIDIQNTGIGISPGRLRDIFDPFEQAENNTAQQFGGSGLGLTISRQLATLMEGEVSVVSQIGVGTTFSLRFPAKLFDAKKLEEHEAMKIELLTKPDRSAGSAAIPSKNCRLLLVEDHDVNQILIKAMTQRLGYHTELAIDGADAVAKIDQSLTDENPFDLILMDLQMPVMDGYEATRMIRASGITAEVLPIIAITANAYSDDIERCIASGMQDHIAKPVMMGNLQLKLAQWTNTDGNSQDPEKGLSDTPLKTVDFIDSELGERYRRRKDEVIHCLTSLVRKGVYTEPELREASGHLHKLAGTAAMFGEQELGIQAKHIENSLTQWKIPDRSGKIKKAVAEFLKVA